MIYLDKTKILCFYGLEREDMELNPGKLYKIIRSDVWFYNPDTDTITLEDFGVGDMFVFLETGEEYIDRRFDMSYLLSCKDSKIYYKFEQEPTQTFDIGDFFIFLWSAEEWELLKSIHILSCKNNKVYHGYLCDNDKYDWGFKGIFEKVI